MPRAMEDSGMDVRRTDGQMSRLKELDAKIFEVSAHGMELIRAKADAGSIRSQVDFLRTLYRSREGILRELAKEGLTEGAIYGRGAYAQEGIYHEKGDFYRGRMAADAGENRGRDCGAVQDRTG